MSKLRGWLVGILTAVYRPVEKMPLEFWGEANIVLSEKESLDNPGPYKRHISVYAPRLLDVFMNDPQWRTLVVQKSSQSAFTLHVLMLICRLLAEVRTSILYVINSIPAAKKISKLRLTPMLENCKATQFQVKENEDSMNNLEYDLPNGIVSLIGAGSAGAFASTPYGLVAFDEMDKAKEFKSEASGWELAINRIKRSEGGKGLGFSTPTDEQGVTHVGYRSGSQHKYFVPCPHCQEKQVLEFEQVRFGHCKDEAGSYDLRRMLKETFYECVHCGESIEDDDKVEMNLGGEWRPTNFKVIDDVVTDIPNWNPFEMSAHISDLYSTHPSSTWGVIAMEFILAQGDPNKLHDWENGRMGRPIKKTVSNIAHRHILRLKARYGKGTLPWQPVCSVGAIDNQGGFQKWMRVGFLANGTCAIVDWGKSLTLESAEELIMQPIPTPDGGFSIPQRIVIDEGGKGGTSYDVRTFCFPRFPVCFPAKGLGRGQGRHIISFSNCSLSRGGLEQIPVCHFDDDSFKRLLYIHRIKGFDAKKCEDFPDTPRLLLPWNTDEQLVRELCGEQLERDEHGQFVWKSYPPNDWGDTLKMCYVTWDIIGHQFSPAKEVAGG